MRNVSVKIIAPVLMSFFVMSFCDIVGIGVDRVKADFGLSNTLAQLIPSAAFFWFLVLSVPIGILQDRLGKKIVLNLGMFVTALGLIVPFLFYSYEIVLVGFALLGIGNTIVQVSANPLIMDVAPKNRGASYLSLSQFIKSVGSMIAAPLAGFFAARYGDWKILFLVFGAVSMLSVLWLSLTKIEETHNREERATFLSSFKLLGNGYIAMMVVCIFLVVGIDVGINSVSGQLLLDKFNTRQELAESARSFYFFGKMLGTFSGAILLTKFSPSRFFLWTSVFSLASIIMLALIPSEVFTIGLIFVSGLALANIFPLVFSLAVGKYPGRSNEISGLMMMAISGGAVLPLLMGYIGDIINVKASISVLVLAIGFILFVAVKRLKEAVSA